MYIYNKVLLVVVLTLFFTNIYCFSTTATITTSSSTISTSKYQSKGNIIMVDRNISTKVNKLPILPKRVILGYANWGECDSNLVTAVEQGVNVLIWFACNLIVTNEGHISITGGPNWDCVAKITKEIKDKNLNVIHLISFGGWNSPHPITSSEEISEEKIREVYDYMHYWNREIIARPDLGWYGFDGFDWDIEGNDTPSSIYNNFTISCLDFMGKLSQIAKSEGYMFAMAPAQSYLDASTSEFDTNLLHTSDDWLTVQNDFSYHGRNCYAYILAKYGKINLLDKQLETFDFITIQLYEGYSHAFFNISQLGVHPQKYIYDFVHIMNKGWNVKFENENDTFIRVPHTHLIIGLANGWAGDGKFLLIDPDHLKAAYNALKIEGLEPLGFGYWNILDEGKISPQIPNKPIYMASSLNEFLNIRITS